MSGRRRMMARNENKVPPVRYDASRTRSGRWGMVQMGQRRRIMLHLQDAGWESLSGDEGKAGSSGVVIEEQALAPVLLLHLLRRLSLDSRDPGSDGESSRRV